MKNKNKTKEKKIKNDIKPKGKKKKIIITILIIILILLILAGSLFGYRVYKNGGGLQGVLATIVGHDENTLKNLPKVYCLVTGQSQNLTDTIMLCSYDPKTQEASILSIPRDTFVGKNKKSATAFDKINALYQSSPEKTVQAVSKLTGIDIKYYLNIDTEALKELVDSVGGVYFDVPIDMDYDDSAQSLHIHMKKGYQLLDGDKAEQVLRFRHNNNGTSYPTEYGDNDLGRMRTQRDFIQAVVKKMATPSTLTKINDFIKIANKNVTTNLDLSLAKDYAPYAVEFKSENLKTGVLPGTPELCNGVWIYTHNATETKQVVKELFGNEEESDTNNTNQNTTNTTNTTGKTNTINSGKTTTKITEAQKKENAKIKIEILNGTSESTKLNKLKSELKEYGYDVTKTGITTNTSKTAIINRTGKSSATMKALKDILGEIGVSSEGSNNSNVDITIIIGKDYNK